ncbi:MAG: hypothetical protein AUK31_01170 [Fibrobacteres bacterium CG2_30_45_31]|nr:MAG: hypothetical protein AUK31_01170 [Fibrobacteres bacterium CG2_30_45_31]
MKKILFLLLLSLMALSACRSSENSDSDSQSSLKQTPSLPKNLRPIEELSTDAPQKKGQGVGEVLKKKKGGWGYEGNSILMDSCGNPLDVQKFLDSTYKSRGEKPPILCPPERSKLGLLVDVSPDSLDIVLESARVKYPIQKQDSVVQAMRVYYCANSPHREQYRGCSR